MEVFSAFFAKVFVRAGSFFHDTNAAAMLPHFTDVALDEEAAQLVTLRTGTRLGRDRLASIRRRAWIVLEAAEAARDLVFFGQVIFEVVLVLCGGVIVVVGIVGIVDIVLLAIAAAGQWGVRLDGAGDIVGRLLGQERARGRRLGGRRLLGIGPGAALGAGGRAGGRGDTGGGCDARGRLGGARSRRAAGRHCEDDAGARGAGGSERRREAYELGELGDQVTGQLGRGGGRGQWRRASERRDRRPGRQWAENTEL